MYATRLDLSSLEAHLYRDLKHIPITPHRNGCFDDRTEAPLCACGDRLSGSGSVHAGERQDRGQSSSKRFSISSRKIRESGPGDTGSAGLRYTGAEYRLLVAGSPARDEARKIRGVHLVIRVQITGNIGFAKRTPIHQ